MRKASMILFTLMPFISLFASWQERKAEGWAWYEEKEGLNEEKDKATTLHSPTEEIKTIRQHLEEKLARALLEPSDDNLKAYMEEQKRWITQSEKFAFLWAQLLLKYPDLDSTLNGNPVSQYGIQLQKQIDNEKRRKLVQEVASGSGLFYFYKGQDKASQVFAMVVQDLAQKYHWNLMPISLDNTLLEMLPQSRIDNGISEKMNVTIVPSLYVVDPNSREAVPIAFGLLSQDQIEKNISLQFQSQKELSQ